MTWKCLITALATIPLLLLLHRFAIHKHWPVGDDIWWVQIGLQDYIHLKNDFFSYLKEILNHSSSQWNTKGSLHSMILSVLLIFTRGKVAPLAMIFSFSAFVTAWYLIYDIFKRLELSRELRVIATSYVISTPIAFTYFWGTSLEATVLVTFIAFVRAGLMSSPTRLNFTMAFAFMTRPILFTTTMASILFFKFEKRKLSHMLIYLFILLHSISLAWALHLTIDEDINFPLAAFTIFIALCALLLFYLRLFPANLPKKSFIFFHFGITAFLFLMWWRVYRWWYIGGGADLMSPLPIDELIISHIWPTLRSSLLWELLALGTCLSFLLIKKKITREVWRRTGYFLLPLLLTLVFVLLKKMPDFRYWMIPLLMTSIYTIYLTDTLLPVKFFKKAFTLFIALWMGWNVLIYSKLAYTKYPPQILQSAWLEKGLNSSWLAWNHGWIPARIITSQSSYKHFIDEIIKKYPQDSQTVFFIRTLLPNDGELAYNEVEFFRTLYQEKEKNYRHEPIQNFEDIVMKAQSCPQDLNCVYLGGPYMRFEDIEEKKNGVEQLLETMSVMEYADELSETGRVFFITGPLKRNK